MFLVHSRENDVEERLKEFLALASSSLLRLGHENEKEAIRTRESVYLLLHIIVKESNVSGESVTKSPIHLVYFIWVSDITLPWLIGHVNNISAMQFFTGISRNTWSESYMLSLTECVWEFRNSRESAKFAYDKRET